ncbi:MAG: HEAT repeat domain-containing protein [Melioribacteraceae bacterium]|jgi:HEAT repeat protein|nr:HEAT repeat domain-containing protein [Melioribacteraceae bacterium]
MKALFMILLLVTVTSLSIEAKRNLDSERSAKYELIEANRLLGLQSDNQGLRESCAYFLGEMKSKKAVFPLMAMLREENAPTSSRIIAALSLIKIGDPQGAYFVSRVAELCDDPITKKFCEKFYKSYLYHKNQEIKDEINDSIAYAE